MGFIDTHVHLHFPEYDADRDEVLARARENDVTGFITVGTGIESTQAALDLAGRFDSVWVAGGIHPHDAQAGRESDLGIFRGLLSHPRMVAIGEIGLDFFRNLSPREDQISLFRKFLDLYREVRKPLVIHCRDAYEDLLRVLGECLVPPYEGVMHCFSSDAAMMKRFLDAGFHISFAGALTYKKNQVLREACRACPLDRLLLETDGPYLAPEPRRGKRNEPAWLIETAKTAAQLHGVALEELGRRTTANAGKLFRLC